MIDRNKLAADIYVALLANPERYKYISSLVDNQKLTNKEATEKNINKAYKLADQFILTANQK